MSSSKTTPVGSPQSSAGSVGHFRDLEKTPSPSRLWSSSELETDAGTIARRKKQVEYGKNTIEYVNYTRAVPRESRADFHPTTPNVRKKYSRRAWDGLVKQWRLNLHVWSDQPDNDQPKPMEEDIDDA